MKMAQASPRPLYRLPTPPLTHTLRLKLTTIDILFCVSCAVLCTLSLSAWHFVCFCILLVIANCFLFSSVTVLQFSTDRPHQPLAILCNPFLWHCIHLSYWFTKLVKLCWRNCLNCLLKCWTIMFASSLITTNKHQTQNVSFKYKVEGLLKLKKVCCMFKKPTMDCPVQVLKIFDYKPRLKLPNLLCTLIDWLTACWSMQYLKC